MNEIPTIRTGYIYPQANPEILLLFGILGLMIIFSPFIIFELKRKIKRFIEKRKRTKTQSIIKICGGLPKPKTKPSKSKPITQKPVEWEPPKPITVPIKKIKKPKIPKKKEIELPKVEERDLSEEKIKSKWLPLIEKLEREGEIEIDSNFHYGSLRGYDIALKLKKDLKRLGYNIHLKGDEKRCRITYTRKG